MIPTLETPELTRLTLDDLGLESEEEQLANKHFRHAVRPSWSLPVA